ncbi:hypothetical protein GE09DRAFT_1230663 [Coniochaeta sp. 2T2.1]|nr:hypothetical protein GE09DRAFT_1230663 [Coniochaeta sp. 2T2.1]
MLPSGRDRVLLDSVRFSYRFLQHLVTGVTDASQRNKTIGDFLLATQPWVQAIEVSQQVPTGNDLVKNPAPPAFSEKEIRAWVSKWFDCVGKLVVLESGQGPRLPVPGIHRMFPTLEQSEDVMSVITAAAVDPQSSKSSGVTILGYLDKSGEIRNSKDLLIGFVGWDGRVLLAPCHPIRETYAQGKLLLWQVPKVSGSQTDSIANIPATASQLGVTIDSESYLVAQPGSDLPLQRVTWEIPPESCSIDDTTIVHLNGTPLGLWEWDRINRFIRLYEKLQSESWTITQVDSALKGSWQVPEASTAASLPTQPSSPTQPTPGSDVFSFSHYKTLAAVATMERNRETVAGNPHAIPATMPTFCPAS